MTLLFKLMNMVFIDSVIDQNPFEMKNAVSLANIDMQSKLHYKASN